MRQCRIGLVCVPCTLKGNIMKYAVLLCDGMADYKIEKLGNKTPMEAANKPVMDMLAKTAVCGLAQNVPDGMVPESDTANLAVMSYDPKVYSKGRSPLEAVSMGLSMSDDDTAFRCNVVTLSEDGENYSDRIMVDNSAGEITTEEADALIKTVDEKLGDKLRRFHTGISYRHCLLWENCPGMYDFTRPHDIIGKRIGDYLPKGEIGDKYLSLFEESYDILKDHPVNLDRKARGLNPGNSIWLWSPGGKPSLPSFKERWGLNASVISAVDLIKGIGICAGMKTVDVPGATGNIHTNFSGKGEAAINEFKNGADFVYIHVEAPDECGHQGEASDKVRSIELIDEKILSPLYDYLKSTEEPFGILVLPDHPTPVCKRTHSREPVPYIMYFSDTPSSGVESFTEANAAATGIYVEHGESLMNYFIKK